MCEHKNRNRESYYQVASEDPEDPFPWSFECLDCGEWCVNVKRTIHETITEKEFRRRETNS